MTKQQKEIVQRAIRKVLDAAREFAAVEYLVTMPDKRESRPKTTRKIERGRRAK